MAIRFLVEGLVESRGIVLCRRLQRTDFSLTNASTLGARPVKGFDIPRKTLPDGSQDDDVFGFFLSNLEDMRSFRIGDEVLLETP
jgi:hypothetical protein